MSDDTNDAENERIGKLADKLAKEVTDRYGIPPERAAEIVAHVFSGINDDPDSRLPQ